MSDIDFQYTDPETGAFLSIVEESGGAVWVRVGDEAITVPPPHAYRLRAFLAGKSGAGPLVSPPRPAPVLRVVNPPAAASPSPHSEAAVRMGFADPNEAA